MSSGRAERAISNGLRLLLATTALAMAAPAPASALEIFGLKLFEGKREAEADVIGTPHFYSMDFIVENGDSEIERALKAASSLWNDRDKPASGSGGLIAKARGDYGRILDALYAEARYGGTISITIGGREVANLPLIDDLPSPSQITVRVQPGPLFRFSEARIVNAAPPAADPDDFVAAPADEGFREGEIAGSQTIIKAGRLSVEAWRQQGYAKAEIAESRVTAAHASDTIAATIELAPSRRAVYGPVGVQGTERMNNAFVAWMTGLEPGEEYDPDDLRKARERLIELGVFRAARIVEADEIEADGSLPLNIVVQERLARRFGVGGSFSTVDGLGLEAYWLHRNLFGRAESLRVEGKVAGIGKSIDPQDFTYRLGATFTRPGVYTPQTNFVASLYGDREVLETYTRTGVTAETGFTHRFTDELSGRIFVNGGFAKFEDDFGTREFVTAGFLGGITYDSRDNAADATEGIYAELRVEPYYEFNYSNAATRIVAEARTYQSLDADNRLILAGRAKIGTLLQPPIAESPPDKLFFAGGGGSVRGFAYRNIGVEAPGGVSGGRSLIELSGEIRARVTQSIGVVGFIDAGYVGAEAFPDFSEDLKIGVGAGLRYQTGLGPIRLDAAVPLDRGPDDPSVAFYVGIGQAF
ncbi:autotransporter assembly complex family protein [Nitratireductor luteus]|uniref:autotransporter assembly complex protein TamA n=1 Tax=Nitratireductor luteus TaxID=2976980 RepID=UPI0030840197